MKIILKFTFCVLVSIALQSYGQEKTSYLDGSWLKTLISIEVESKNDKGTNYIPQGTGFLLQSPLGHCALFTAKHVIYDEQAKKVKENLVYRLNRKGKNSDPVSEAYVLSVAKTGWIWSDTVDIAARMMIWGDDNDIASIPLNSVLKVNPEAGANVYVMGFPLGLRMETYSAPIVRQGIVSLVEPLLIDAFIFPGNSGGPVIYVPLIPLGKEFKTNVIQENKLIGMVIGYLPFQDVAISQLTKQPRIIFQENTGLCQVIPSKIILEFLNSAKFTEVDKNSYAGAKVPQDKKDSNPGK